ncbi:hypothetical protein O0D39_00655 [Staphylococcus pseudintermedius]|nr:hypothetical protein [Staphylococcus pseudintermedius]MDE9977134.1 hypothetical protein [Staphylococcus pseudintermedius]MDE9996315.1 hypothetical protein [Staphylococcus pseudintermedius]MDK3827451.1 hypothetical protein [Staphylococcus pseudintermedius]MDK4102723.1 hypothetical protein [Staphylococcus pseudintermedius]
MMMWTQEGEDSENLAPLTELKTGGATTNSGEAGRRQQLYRHGYG